MIEITLQDLMLWSISISLIVIGLLRIFSKFRRWVKRKSQRKNIVYCNVCVSYFHDDSEEKYVKCPSCKREMTRGRKRKLG